MAQLNFVREGRGPVMVLSHALGGDLSMWDGLVPYLKDRFTVLRYDQRGHGGSEVVHGPHGIGALADDAAQLIAQQADGPVHFVGISMGGMVAQQLAARHPELVTSIVVANSSSHYDETARGMWRARIETVLNLGMPAIAEGAMQRWFTRQFREDVQGAKVVAELRRRFEATDARAYAASCEAVARIDFGATNPHIACPTLVIAGLRDEATPPAMSDVICNTISGAVQASLDTAHLSATEKPAAFAELVCDFVKTL